MDERQLIRVAKAMADPTRFNLFQAIANCSEISCGELANRHGIAPATVSHHLKILVESGLVEVRREGQFTFVRKVSATLSDYTATLSTRFTTTALPADLQGEALHGESLTVAS